MIKRKIIEFLIKVSRFINYRFRRPYYTLLVKLTAQKVGSNLMVNKMSKVLPNTIIGDYVGFNGITIKGYGKVVFGNNFYSGSDCLIISSNHNYDHGKAIPFDGTQIKKEVIIEDNVWFGERVIVLGKARIGEGAIIQAGSVVIGEIPKCAIAGGHPAKVFKYRDIKHYEKMKKEGNLLCHNRKRSNNKTVGNL